MPYGELDLGLVVGPPGNIVSSTVKVTPGHSDSPTATAVMGGEPGAQTIEFTFEGLQGDDADVSIATTDNAGLVKPDGTSIKVTQDGTISVETIPVATSDKAGIVKPDGKSIKVTTDGTISVDTVAVATTEIAGTVKPDGKTIHVDDTGTISVHPGTSDQVILGDGTVQSIEDFVTNNADTIRDVLNLGESLSAPDPRPLRKAIDDATALHDNSWSGSQSDPLLGSWNNTEEAMTALQAAIDAAKKVSDGYLKDYFTQAELDDAKNSLDEAVAQFKSTGKEVKANLEEFNSLKARVKAIDDSANVSENGKDVTFGETWVTSAEKLAASTAVDTCQTAIDQATKQSQIDTACDTLEKAVTTYESAVKTATADTAALDAMIEKANKSVDGVQVSADGEDLPAGSRYVTDQATLDTINEAISTATAAKTASTTQNQLDDATTTLSAAIAAFEEFVEQNVTIYGVRFNNFPTTTKGIRTDAAAEFGDIKPAVNNGSGSSPFDNIAPWSEMVPSDRTGGRMVKIPKFYYKLTQDGKGIDVQIATGPLEGYHISPAHMDRNDGKGEREEVYVGRYHCATSTYKSTTKVNPANNANKSTMITSIKKLGSEYHMMDFATRFTIWLLYLVETAEWNSQKLIGYGCSTGNSLMQMGYTDSMQYCTGTTVASATNYGGTQYRNIEGLWDNVYDFLSGCYNDSKGFNVITDISKMDGETGGKLVGMPVAGYPGELKVSDTGDFPAIYPSASNGSTTTGTCDYWNFNASGPVVFCGGNYAQVDGHGLFYMDCAGTSYSVTNIGSRLLELP